MAGALVVYCLCGLSGVLVARRVQIDHLLGRLFLVVSAAAGQLLLSIQLLSLWKVLTPWGLLLASAALTGTACVALSLWSSSATSESWRSLFSKVLGDLKHGAKDQWTLALVTAATLLFATGCVAGWLVIPLNDCYHFEMPRFWVQHRTILPYPVHNPRILSLSFFSEALQLPGYLSGHGQHMPEVMTFLAGILCLAVIFSLACRIGAGVVPSIGAASIAVGYTLFVLNCLSAAAEMFLTGALFGASLLFLMEACLHRNTIASFTKELGCSVFFFMMSCGAKNTTSLLAPFYGVFLVYVLKSSFFPQLRIIGSKASLAKADVSPVGSPAAEGIDRPIERLSKLTLGLLACGLAGAICSGLAWNYASNSLWFGDMRGPKGISGTVAQDFHPRAIWTRICRGAVLMACDTIWVPNSAKGKYVKFCETTVKTLGGQLRTAEDDQYDCFGEKAVTPRKGLGLLGICFFLPGLVAAGTRCFPRTGLKPDPIARCNTVLLVTMTIGSFVICHLVLRWQSIGLLRLMFPFVISGAPLSALLLSNRWLRVTAFCLLLISGAMFSVFWLGHLSRRLGWSERPSWKWIARLQNDYAQVVSCEWKGLPPTELTMHESYTYREIYEELLQRIHQPCSIGFIGGTNSECVFLFGRQSQNRVFPLIDSRTDQTILEPPAEAHYVVSADKFLQTGDWAVARGFQQIFACSNAQGPMLLAFERTNSTPARNLFGLHKSIEAHFSAPEPHVEASARTTPPP